MSDGSMAGKAARTCPWNVLVFAVFTDRKDITVGKPAKTESACMLGQKQNLG